MIALTRQARMSNFVQPVNSVIRGFLLWGNVSTITLVVWVGLVWASSAAFASGSKARSRSGNAPG